MSPQNVSPNLGPMDMTVAYRNFPQTSAGFNHSSQKHSLNSHYMLGITSGPGDSKTTERVPSQPCVSPILQFLSCEYTTGIVSPPLCDIKRKLTESPLSFRKWLSIAPNSGMHPVWLWIWIVPYQHVQSLGKMLSEISYRTVATVRCSRPSLSKSVWRPKSLSGQAQDGIIVKGREKPRLLAWD